VKKIINGLTYKTDTSTLIAKAESTGEAYFQGPEETTHSWLYQTRGGAFFLHERTETSKKDKNDEWKQVARNEFFPMTYDRALRWFMSAEVELLSDVFGEPPEATAEPTQGATLYIRVPTSLKGRLETLANKESCL
jgi:hypothetical protein